MRKAVLLIAALASSCTKHYRAEGVVLRVNPQERTVTISHRAIPGYMEAMAMPFPVRKPAELEGLAPGARITFGLEVSRHGTLVSRIRRESTRIEDVPQLDQSQKLAVGAVVPDFALQDQRGHTVHLSDLRGRVLALDFIYTRCPIPDVCPRLSANFARLQKRYGARITLVSITIDPQYDTPPVLTEYARRWQANPDNWIFLTGSPDAIGAVAAKFGLVYWPEEGTITHTAATAIIGPSGELKALLEGSSYTSQQLLDLVETALASGL